MVDKLMMMCGMLFISLSVKLFAGLCDLFPIVKKYTKLVVYTDIATESLYVQIIVLLNIIAIFALFSTGCWLVCVGGRSST